MDSLVTSLELSKKLKALGVEQKSQFYWIEEPPVKYSRGWFVIFAGDLEVLDFIPKEIYPAFTATELMEMMPEKINNNPESFLNIEKRDGKYSAWYTWEDQAMPTYIETDTPQEALGLLLVHILENKLIQVNEK